MFGSRVSGTSGIPEQEKQGESPVFAFKKLVLNPPNHCQSPQESAEVKKAIFLCFLVIHSLAVDPEYIVGYNKMIWK